MAMNGKKNKGTNAIIDRALRVGLRQAAQPEKEDTVVLHLTAAQEQMVVELCQLLGLSARSVLNAALRYALQQAAVRGVPATRLREFPKQVAGRSETFALTADTLAKACQADMLNHLPECTLAGLTLLHGKLLKVKVTR